MLASYTPMAPTLVREPFHREGWVFEEKVDGWRMLAYKDGTRGRLISRNGRDHSRRFAGIAAAIAKLSARALVLDGEVAIFDEQLRSRFDWLREPDPNALATLPMLMAFDLLHENGRELSGRPLRDRRDRLPRPASVDRVAAHAARVSWRCSPGLSGTAVTEGVPPCGPTGRREACYGSCLHSLQATHLAVPSGEAYRR
jgi:ATP-dependent DNA ligase